MRPEKYQAVADIVSTIIAKQTLPETGARPTPAAAANTQSAGKPGGVTVRFTEGKIFLYDTEGGRMTLEELIQYVDRYLA